MNLRRWLAALFVILALAGCAQVAIEQGQQPYTPYPPETERDTQWGRGYVSGGL
jgi:hypothetical protein